MTAHDGQDELEAQFAQWRTVRAAPPGAATVRRRRTGRPPRGSVDELVAAGLSPDEAFLVAVKRMGSLDDLSREFAREHSERLWKQLVLTGDHRRAGAAGGRRTRDGRPPSDPGPGSYLTNQVVDTSSHRCSTIDQPLG